jgi:hypothetical protein
MECEKLFFVDHHPESERRISSLSQKSKVKTIAVRGKFAFSVLNLFFPVSDVQILRFSFLQAPI